MPGCFPLLPLPFCIHYVLLMAVNAFELTLHHVGQYKPLQVACVCIEKEQGTKMWVHIGIYIMYTTTITTQCKLQNKCSFVCGHISKCLVGIEEKHHQFKLRIMPTAIKCQ